MSGGKEMKALISLSLLLSFPAIALSDLATDQINAVDRVSQQSIQNQKDQAQRERDTIAQQQRDETDARERVEKARISAWKEQKRRIAAANKAREEERISDKKRFQAQEDEDRTLEIEGKQLDLQMKRARAARADEYVTQELNREKAATDAVQSSADAARNISEGEKELRSGIGKGAEAKGKSWFK